MIAILLDLLDRFKFQCLFLVFQPFELQLLSQPLVTVPDVTTHLQCLVTFYEMSVSLQIQTSSQMAVIVVHLY